MNRLLLLLSLVFTLVNHAQIVHIPDDNFKFALLSNRFINTNFDTEIQVEEAKNFTKPLDLTYKGIKDLTGIEAFTNLKRLKCSYNELETLNLSSNTALKWIECNNNKLKFINLKNIDLRKLIIFDATKNEKLTCIEVDDIAIAKRKLRKKPPICSLTNNCSEIVSIPDNNFKRILLRNKYINTNNDNEIQIKEAEAYKETIYLVQKRISDLTGIEAFKNITGLNCNVNYITSLDLSENKALVELKCVSNELTFLNLSNNNKLRILNCNNNKLRYLNLKNINLSNATYFDTRSNLRLGCIEVDDVELAKKNIYTGRSSYFSTNCSETYVKIPDVNFKKALLKNRTLNRNNDFEIQIEEAKNYKGDINVSSKYVSSIAGIEAFTNIRSFNCSQNKLTDVDFSNNLHLKSLNCSNNSLTYIDISKNTKLTHFYCGYNQLKNIDLSKNIALERLYCNANELTNLNIENNIALKGLICRSNELTNLNIKNNSLLEYLSLSSNKLKTINTNDNLKLKQLYCSFNELKELDLSKNVNLSMLYCQNNQLSSLNLKNISISNLNNFSAQNNPKLTCIQVDDVAAAQTALSSKIDAIASFSTNCSTLSNDEVSLEGFKIYPNPANNYITIANTNFTKAIIYDVLGRKIKNFKLTTYVTNTYTISDIKEGSYIIQLINNKQSITKKILVK